MQATLLATLDRLRGSVTVLLATHDLALAATCDRVAILHDRGIECYGSTAETLTPPILAATLGVLVRRIDDPLGGPPLLRIMAPFAPAVTT
jgi:iron complex transport system ATP-binding protein